MLTTLSCPTVELLRETRDQLFCLVLSQDLSHTRDSPLGKGKTLLFIYDQ